MANMPTSLLLLLLLLAAPAVYAVEYTVGDNSGWTQGVDYTNWVSGRTFKVGDVLVFSYGGTHQVDRVSQSDYNSCASSNALESHNDGNTKINLTAPGTSYFICPTGGHCTGGMKLAVTVTAAPSTSPAATPPPTAPSGSPQSGSDSPSSGTPPTTTDSSPPPSPSNGADSIFCNIYNVMAVVISFVVVAALMS